MVGKTRLVVFDVDSVWTPESHGAIWPNHLNDMHNNDLPQNSSIFILPVDALEVKEITISSSGYDFLKRKKCCILEHLTGWIF